MKMGKTVTEAEVVLTAYNTTMVTFWMPTRFLIRTQSLTLTIVKMGRHYLTDGSYSCYFAMEEMEIYWRNYHSCGHHSVGSTTREEIQKRESEIETERERERERENRREHNANNTDNIDIQMELNILF